MLDVFSNAPKTQRLDIHSGAYTPLDQPNPGTAETAGEASAERLRLAEAQRDHMAANAALDTMESKDAGLWLRKRSYAIAMRDILITVWQQRDQIEALRLEVASLRREVELVQHLP